MTRLKLAHVLPESILILPLKHAKHVQLAAIFVRVLMIALNVLTMVKPGTLLKSNAFQAVVRLANMHFRMIVVKTVLLNVPLAPVLMIV